MLPTKRAPTHPGEILQEDFLKPLGLSQMAFAKNLGWTYARLNEIVRERRGMTPESALSFSKALGTSPDIWLNLQQNYDLWYAMRSQKNKRKIKRIKRILKKAA